jgi:teichoic acid ribitol-phosphate primase
MRKRAAIRLALVRLGFRLGRLLGPPRRRVVLATSHADEISGNLAYIRDELARRRPPIPTVVIANRPDPSIRGLLTSSVGALRSGFHLAMARLSVVDDYFLPMYAEEPRPGCTYVQVWHAAGAFKKFGYSILDKTFGQTEDFVRRLAIHTNYSVSLVSAKRFAPFYADAFRQPEELFTSTIGIPRTDVFFGEQRAAAEARVRARYPLPPKRTILYAPTFRGETISRARSPQDLDLGLLRDRLGDDHVVLLRQHPFVRASRPPGPDLAGFVIDVSDYPDINELMLVSDVLVTDYSSAIYEFSLTGRPMAFFAPDHASYEGERGFYFDFRTGLPGPVFETTEALASWLRAGEFDLERVARFREEAFDVADGHATERFVDQIVEPALR